MRLTSALIVVAAFAVVAARPYEDTKGRFRVSLADKWELMPQFGDMAGMTFRRVVKSRKGDVPAILLVHMDSVQASDAKEYADAVEKELERQPAYKRLEERASMVGGKPALVREYKMLVSKKPKVEKMVRRYFLESGGHLYLLHFESTLQEFKHVEKDIDDMVASFVPLGGKSGADKSSDRDLGLAPQSISGRWINSDELVMVLGDDGSFALADASGRYEVKGETLTMIIPNQGRESFTFVHDTEKGTLTLTSPNLGEPMVYKRISGALSAKKEKPDRTEKHGGSDESITGHWSTATPNGGTLDLDLRSDKSFSMGEMRGEWSFKGDRLTLKRSAKESIEYRARIDGKKLLLSGGDLDAEVAFSKTDGS